jgi:hypothetical protein
MLKKHSVAIALGFMLAHFALPVNASGAVKLRPVVEPNKQVLVLPFSSKLQQEEYQDIQESLLQTLEANITAALQTYGIGAEQYAGAVADGSLKPGVPASGESPPPPAASSEPVGTVTPDEVQAAPDAAPSAPAAELTLLEQAKAGRYDYVLTGSIVFLQAEVKPAIQAGNRKMTSIRAQVSCSFRLTATDGSSRSFSGMSAGEDARSIINEGAERNTPLLVSGTSQVINRAIIAAAQNTARKLAAPESGDGTASGGSPYGAGDVQPEREYYQDSPGKKLRP